MGGSNFERIAQALHHQKRLMDDLLAENRELRQQLSDLREGRGIFLEINGKRFALSDLVISHNNAAIKNVEQKVYVAPPQTTPVHSSNTHDDAFLTAAAPQTTQKPATSTSKPNVTDAPIAQQTEIQEQDQEQSAQNEQPTFLEEVMLDEFASAMTSPMSVWRGPAQEPKQPITQASPVNEEQRKATLRQELHGSFLLE